MKIHRYVLTFSALTIFLLAASIEANACWCVDPGTGCEKVGRSDTIFIGRVVAAKVNTPRPVQDGDEVERWFGPDQTVTLQVEENFLGAKFKTIDIVTGASDCDFWFKSGERYLVYASHGADGKVHTSKCSGTKTLDKAEEDLAFLRNLPRKGIGARIYGKVLGFGQVNGKYDIQGLAGVPVSISGPGRNYDLTTDDSGEYDLAGIPAGKYRISISVPNNYRQDELSETVTVNDRGCLRQSFVPHVDSLVSGIVLDEQGRAIAGAKVNLVSAGPEIDTWEKIELSEETDAEGKFTFEKMPPGHYLLGVNLDDTPDPSFPYFSTYFPGVTDRVNAQALSITLGQKLTDLSLRLTGKLIPHKVTGKVVWPDGKPAQKSRVYLSYQDQAGEWQITDLVDTGSDGQFSVIGFEGFDYSLRAFVERSGLGGAVVSVYAIPTKLDLKEDRDDITLTLSLSGAHNGKDERQQPAP